MFKMRWADENSTRIFCSQSSVTCQSLFQSGSYLTSHSCKYRWVNTDVFVCTWAAPLSSGCTPLTVSQDRCVSPGVAAPGLSSRTGRGAQMSPVAPPALTQHKVIVGGRAHGIKHVGFVGDLELWGRKRNEAINCILFYLSLLHLLLFQLGITAVSHNDKSIFHFHFKSI